MKEKDLSILGLVVGILGTVACSVAAVLDIICEDWKMCLVMFLLGLFNILCIVNNDYNLRLELEKEKYEKGDSN